MARKQLGLLEQEKQAIIFATRLVTLLDFRRNPLNEVNGREFRTFFSCAVFHNSSDLEGCGGQNFEIKCFVFTKRAKIFEIVS